MKKLLLTIAVLTSLAFTANAQQDTIHIPQDTVTVFEYDRYVYLGADNPPAHGRFFTIPITDNILDHMNGIYEPRAYSHYNGGKYGASSARLFVMPNDTIYGVSVNICRLEDYDEGLDSLMIYVKSIDDGRWRVIDSVKWTPDARPRWLRMWALNRSKEDYVYLDTSNGHYHYLPWDQQEYTYELYIPLYEVYFREPIAVPDSIFIVGSMRGDFSGYYSEIYPVSIHDTSYIVYGSDSEPPYLYGLGTTTLQDWALYFPIVKPLADWDTLRVHQDTIGGGDNPGDNPGGGQDTIGGGTEKVVQADGALELKLFPNPTDGAVRIECGQPLEAVRVRDMRGCTVYEHKGDVPSLDTGRWPKGVYIVEATTQAGKIIKKLIVR